MKLAFALVSCLVLLLSGAAGAQAQTPANVTVNIIHDQSSACYGGMACRFTISAASRPPRAGR